VAFAALQGGPEGLLVVTVMVTVFPMSADTGVYVNENGERPDEEGLTAPDPFSFIVTAVALPPNIFPETVTGVLLHVLPLVELRLTVGPFIQAFCPEPVNEINKN
jgi:hypothetical protein